jgi:hypothetical protein
MDQIGGQQIVQRKCTKWYFYSNSANFPKTMISFYVVVSTYELIIYACIKERKKERKRFLWASGELHSCLWFGLNRYSLLDRRSTLVKDTLIYGFFVLYHLKIFLSEIESVIYVIGILNFIKWVNLMIHWFVFDIC